MGDQGQWLDWIDENNQEQALWAISYLRKKGISLLHSDSPSLQLRGVSNAWLFQTAPEEVATRERLVFQMKAAWSKEKSRKKKTGHKPYSFEMSAQVGPALKRLRKAQGLPISQALESLILNTDAFRRDLEEGKKTKFTTSQQATVRHAERQKQQLVALKQMIQEWESAADDLLTHGARYQVALKANGLLGKNHTVHLEPEQEIAAGKLHRRWKESLTKSINAKTRLARLMLGPLDQSADELQQGIKSIRTPN